MRATGGDHEHNRSEFAVLYREHVDLVYRCCRHRLGSSEEAEDATSQIFLKALSAYPKHRKDGSFRSWLFSIAHNQITDLYRRRRPLTELVEAASRPSPDRSPEDEALNTVEQDEIHELLLILPIEQRRVLELRLVGLDTAEIATVLGKTQAAIRMSQSRAFAKLRQVLVAVDLEARVEEKSSHVLKR